MDQNNRELNFDYTVGDTVYCIDNKQTSPRAAFDFQSWPELNKPYKVRGFAENDGIVTGVYLEELRNKPMYFKLLGREQEPAFAVWRFKKAEEVTGHAEDELLNEILEEHEKVEANI